MRPATRSRAFRIFARCPVAPIHAGQTRRSSVASFLGGAARDACLSRPLPVLRSNRWAAHNGLKVGGPVQAERVRELWGRALTLKVDVLLEKCGGAIAA